MRASGDVPTEPTTDEDVLLSINFFLGHVDVEAETAREVCSNYWHPYVCNDENPPEPTS